MTGAAEARRDPLLACPAPAHEFRLVPGSGRWGLLPVYRCARCGGRADARDLKWYVVGLRHGKALASRRQRSDAASAAGPHDAPVPAPRPDPAFISRLIRAGAWVSATDGRRPTDAELAAAVTDVLGADPDPAAAAEAMR